MEEAAEPNAVKEKLRAQEDQQFEIPNGEGYSCTLFNTESQCQAHAHTFVVNCLFEMVGNVVIHLFNRLRMVSKCGYELNCSVLFSLFSQIEFIKSVQHKGDARHDNGACK